MFSYVRYEIGKTESSYQGKVQRGKMTSIIPHNSLISVLKRKSRSSDMDQIVFLPRQLVLNIWLPDQRLQYHLVLFRNEYPSSSPRPDLLN